MNDYGNALLDASQCFLAEMVKMYMTDVNVVYIVEIVWIEFISGTLTVPFVKAIRSCNYLSLITDLLPDNAFDIDIVKNRALKKIIRGFCLMSYKQADRIIVITEAIRNRLIEYGICSQKISLVELAVDTERFKPLPSDLHGLGLSAVADKFIVLYSGSFGHMYDFDVILDSANEVAKMTDRIHFVIRGGGDQKDYIKEKISKLKLENTSLLDPVSDTETVISFINAASVCIVPIRNSRAIDPSKLLEFWSCGKPVICTTRGETAQLIRKFDAGIAIDPGDKDSLVQAILFLFNNPKRLIEMGQKGRTNVVKTFSFNRIREKLCSQIDQL